MKVQNIFSICAVLIMLVCIDAECDGRKQELTELFAQLKITRSTLESREIENQIWSIWMTSPDSESQEIIDNGTAAMQSGDFKRALYLFDKLIDRVPAYAEAWNKRATLYFLMDKYVLSLKDIAETLKLEPNHFGAISGMALIQIRMNNPVKALKYYEMALLIGPNLTGVKENIDKLRHQLSEDSI